MDIIINNFFYLWLVAALFCVLMEMGSPGLFFFLSFFFGALVAAGATFFVELLYVQMLLFFVGTGCAFILLRYCILPLLGKGRVHERTNVYAMMGKRGFVVGDISKEIPGFVKIDGATWVARSASGELIAKGSAIEVVRVHGAHVVVKKI